MADVYDFSCKTITGETKSLRDYAGKVLLIVNTASKCGFTPQYEGLESVYRKYKDEGLEVLGFPCNQFMHQEPGKEDEIRQFCSLKYDVSFPMFAKIDVNGDHTDPLFRHLKSEAPGIAGTQAIKWNFTKFLVDRKGKVLKRFATATKPEAISGAIEQALAER
jgi:glutathione peroxidase